MPLSSVKVRRGSPLLLDVSSDTDMVICTSFRGGEICPSKKTPSLALKSTKAPGQPSECVKDQNYITIYVALI